MITSVWPLPYECMWSIAESKSETSSIAHANAPYSCFKDLALGGPKVKRDDNFGPENSSTYNSHGKKNLNFLK